MSGPSDKGRFSRRAVTIGGGIAVALGLTAVGVTVPRLFAKRYKPSPYDDLFAKLIDRDAAVKIGRDTTSRVFGTGGPSRPALAAALRRRLQRRTLAEVTAADLAQGHIVEVSGWVMPLTLVMLCTLAAAEEG